MTATILQNTISTFNFFKLKVLIAECVTLESQKKKTVECCSNEQRTSFLELSLGLGFGIMTATIVQNTISRFNFVQIESADS